jgi:hypothetical protein
VDLGRNHGASGQRHAAHHGFFNGLNINRAVERLTYFDISQRIFSFDVAFLFLLFSLTFKKVI